MSSKLGGELLVTSLHVRSKSPKTAASGMTLTEVLIINKPPENILMFTFKEYAHIPKDEKRSSTLSIESAFFLLMARNGSMHCQLS